MDQPVMVSSRRAMARAAVMMVKWASVGDVAFPPGQGAGPFLQVAVAGGTGQVHEAVAFDGDLSCDGFLGLGDLGVDPA